MRCSWQWLKIPIYYKEEQREKLTVIDIMLQYSIITIKKAGTGKLQRVFTSCGREIRFYSGLIISQNGEKICPIASLSRFLASAWH